MENRESYTSSATREERRITAVLLDYKCWTICLQMKKCLLQKYTEHVSNNENRNKKGSSGKIPEIELKSIREHIINRLNVNIEGQNAKKPDETNAEKQIETIYNNPSVVHN